MTDPVAPTPVTRMRSGRRCALRAIRERAGTTGSPPPHDEIRIAGQWLQRTPGDAKRSPAGRDPVHHGRAHTIGSSPRAPDHTHQRAGSARAGPDSVSAHPASRSTRNRRRRATPIHGTCPPPSSRRNRNISVTPAPCGPGGCPGKGPPLGRSAPRGQRDPERARGARHDVVVAVRRRIVPLAE